MGALPFSTHNLTQVFLALLPDNGTGQNIGRREKLTEIQDILKFGIDINSEIHPGYTPLCKVIECGGSKALVELLLNAGAKIETNKEFAWQDVDGRVIKNQVYALARQRVQKYQDKESLEILELIQNQWMALSTSSQEVLDIKSGASLSRDNDSISKNKLFPKDQNISLAQSVSSEDPSHSTAPLMFIEGMFKKKIYIFDFDNCIVNGNFHNILKNMGVAPGRASPDLVEFLLEKYGIKNKELLLCIFRDILKNKDCICIASNTRYPETLSATLNALGLTQEEQSQIYYEPPVLESIPDLTQGKNLDVLKAMIHFSVIDINSVYLIDYDKTNLQIAKSRLNIPESNLIKVEIGNEAFPSHLQLLQKTLRKSFETLEEEENKFTQASQPLTHCS